MADPDDAALRARVQRLREAAAAVVCPRCPRGSGAAAGAGLPAAAVAHGVACHGDSLAAAVSAVLGAGGDLLFAGGLNTPAAARPVPAEDAGAGVRDALMLARPGEGAGDGAGDSSEEAETGRALLRLEWEARGAVSDLRACGEAAPRGWRFAKWHARRDGRLHTVLAAHGRLVFARALRRAPRMAYVTGLFSAEEAAAIIAVAAPNLHPSRVVAHSRAESGGAPVEVERETRSSWSCKVDVTHDCVRHVLQRTCMLLGVDPGQAEAVQVVRYQPVRGDAVSRASGVGGLACAFINDHSGGSRLLLLLLGGTGSILDGSGCKFELLTD
jgi:hypothetical protein